MIACQAREEQLELASASRMLGRLTSRDTARQSKAYATQWWLQPSRGSTLDALGANPSLKTMGQCLRSGTNAVMASRAYTRGRPIRRGRHGLHIIRCRLLQRGAAPLFAAKACMDLGLGEDCLDMEASTPGLMKMLWEHLGVKVELPGMSEVSAFVTGILSVALPSASGGEAPTSLEGLLQRLG